MPKAVLEAVAAEGDAIPDDTWLLAELVAVTTKDVPRRDGTTWTKWLWKWVVTDDGQYDGRVVWGETDGSFKHDSTNVCFQWVSELLATELAEGFELDTDDLLGSVGRINVTVREYEKGGEMRSLREVSNVLRAQRPAAMEPF